MHILIIPAIYVFIGIVSTAYMVKLDLDDGFDFDPVISIIAIIVWPVYVGIGIQHYILSHEVRKNHERSVVVDGDNNGVIITSSTKSDFGPGYYGGVKDPLAFLDDLNDPLDNSGYYDDRYFAKAALERKKD